ncbi:hypothetical protein JEQ12_018972 [Ovis aries]|uniref:S-phase kinase-associated protein 1 n=1 Tax=Ovis aries TaxID=9940 RepID=A0A836ACT9_SHEEP|nr:hypothetical protein JEQ12_018972 [Ovis aries]
MDAEYPAFEPPLCSELKHLCKRLQEAYRELKEDLTPFRDDRYYRFLVLILAWGQCLDPSSETGTFEGVFCYKLQSSDGEIIEVDIEIAKQSVTLKTTLEDLGMSDEGDDDPVPLPNVNAAILEKVIQWCTHHKDDPPPEDDENKGRRTDDIPVWDQEFLKVDQGTLFELILAANYLDIKVLLDVTCKAWLAPMRLYTLSKHHFVLVFVVFFVCFGLTVFVGIRGPKVIQTSAANFSLNNSKKLKPIQIFSKPLSTYNQQLWLTCVVELDQSKETSIQTTFTMTVKVDGVAQDGTTKFIHNKVHNRTRTLTCAEKCAEIIVAHLSYLNYTKYTVTVGFEHLKRPVKDLNFTWKTYDPAFSHLEIWFRFVFVVLTFIVTCLFAHSLRKFSMRDWGIEQKWMSILLPLLLLYNDPFFPLSFLVNSWFPGMLDDLFQSVFLCALLLFWLCAYHGIRVQGERKCLTFYLPKFFIVGLLWLASVTLGIWQTVNELHDPMYQYRVDTGNFQGMKVFFMVVAAVYILYLLFLIVRACSELGHMPYVAEFLSFYGLLNFYLYTLAFVYSPSKNALYESQLKDNPAFSMLNDSDDDVIYGSDYEEMPLQNGQAIRAQYKEGSESD